MKYEFLKILFYIILRFNSTRYKYQSPTIGTLYIGGKIATKTLLDSDAAYNVCCLYAL